MDKEANGVFESEHPGRCGARDTQTFIGTAWADDAPFGGPDPSARAAPLALEGLPTALPIKVAARPIDSVITSHETRPLPKFYDNRPETRSAASVPRYCQEQPSPTMPCR